MLTALRASHADQTYEKRLLRYIATALLIVDDVGQRPLDGQEPIDLYLVIPVRYERGAIMRTSNRVVEEC